MTRWFTKEGSSASEAGKVFSGGKKAWVGEWEEKGRNTGGRTSGRDAIEEEGI